MAKWLLATALLLVGCGAEPPKSQTDMAPRQDTQFRVVARENVNTYLDIYVLQHKVTGTCWIWVSGYEKGGFTQAPAEVCQ